MNQPDIRNVQRSIRTSRKLDAKVIKGYRTNPKMTIKDAYILALTFATKDIELDIEDEERILADMKRARAALLKSGKGKKGKAVAK